jgi:hypothetical protein
MNCIIAILTLAPLFLAEGIVVVIPIWGNAGDVTLSFPIPMTADEVLDRSLGYEQRDVVRDGLPHFGAARDDWNDKPDRRHVGFDIYCDDAAVRATAPGVVDKAGGQWLSIVHSERVRTVYVHVSDIRVSVGDSVARSQTIAFVRGSRGNAVEPQLHFEVQLDGRKVDPLPFLRMQFPDDSDFARSCDSLVATIPERVAVRRLLVDEFLRSR